MTFQRMFMDKQQSVDLTNEFTVYRDRGLLATVESLPAGIVVHRASPQREILPPMGENSGSPI